MTLTSRILELKRAEPDLTSIQIGHRLGCASAYVRAVAQRHNLTFGPGPKLTEAQRSAITQSEENSKALAYQYGVGASWVRKLRKGHAPVPAAVLADRRRRQEALNHQSLTGALMGDPPPRQPTPSGPAGRVL